MQRDLLLSFQDLIEGYNLVREYAVTIIYLSWWYTAVNV